MEESRVILSTDITPRLLICTPRTAVSVFQTFETHVPFPELLKSLVWRQFQQLSTIRDIMEAVTEATPQLLLRSLNTVSQYRAVRFILAISGTASANSGHHIRYNLYRLLLLLLMMRSYQGSLRGNH